MPYITKQFKFCAAHKYWNNKWDKKKNIEIFEDDVRVHGHNYDLDITIKGNPDPESGFIINISELKQLVNERVLKFLDHSEIQKDIKWFENKQPSTENLVIFIWNQLYDKIPENGILYTGTRLLLYTQKSKVIFSHITLNTYCKGRCCKGR